MWSEEEERGERTSDGKLSDLLINMKVTVIEKLEFQELKRGSNEHQMVHHELSKIISFRLIACIPHSSPITVF